MDVPQGFEQHMLRWLQFVIASIIGIHLSGCRPSPIDLSVASNGNGDSTVKRSRAAPRLSSIFDLRDVKPSLDPESKATDVMRASVFHDVALSSGIEHQYVTGEQKLLLMVQPTGGGCGWIDYDGDGHWDLYLNQGGDPSAPPSSSQPSDQLFRNIDGHRFEQVSLAANIEERDYSQGVAIADFDNDGFADIFVTNSGKCTLFQNQGDGTFLNVSDQTLKQIDGWHSSAAWGDIDRDGDLDLYVCRYVEFDRFHPQTCLTPKGVRRMCQPNEIDPRPDELYLNQGDGTFRPVAQEIGLYGPANKALGVAIADFDNDDWPDIYVANDATPNFLFINQRNGQFLDMANVLGCAVGADGRAQASMGVAVGDIDRNGFLDLYLTHFDGEWNTLYRNLGVGGFVDATAALGGVEVTIPLVGFGTVMEDFNQDSYDELLIANGHLDDPGHLGIDLAMKSQHFSFDGRKLIDTSEESGDYFSKKFIGRGMATADYDSDGDLDVVVVNQDSPVSLLRNDSDRGHWIKLEFIGTTSNRRGIGTRVTLRSGNEVFIRELAGGTSYCSSHQPVLVFGMGNRTEACDLDIRWPSGAHQTISQVSVDQSLLIIEEKN